MPGGRVLMIAHHFPPAGGSGANRALAFARHLPEHGWKPTVLTPGAAWAAQRDAALVSEIPVDLRVVRTRSFERRANQAVSGRMTSSLSSRPASKFRSQLGHLKRFPDAHIGWLPFAVAAGIRERYDVACSSSGPFTSHLVGLLLRRITHKPWVAELRDGWYRWNRSIFPDYPAWRDALERRLEAAALRSADRVVLVTDRMADAFRAQYADLPASHFAVVPNGFDPAQFQVEPAGTPAGWEVVYAGALYYGRSLSTFLQAARLVIESDAQFARDFSLTLVGTLDGRAADEVARSGIREQVKLLGQIDHAAAIATMRRSDALLLVANTTPGAEATVPGKLFEYLAVGRPIIAVAPRDSSPADMLRQTGGGWLAEAGDTDAIACVLRRSYRERDCAADPEAVACFDRRRLTGDLARIFDEVFGGAPRRV
jgi:glycosyltransferase involved in cell wall biosynthesis